MMLRTALVILLLASTVICAEPSQVKLDESRLAGPLTLLSEDDQKIVDGAIRLIRSGDHGLALIRLAELNSKNPQNSSLRILTAYTQLQLANLAGAFEEAAKAERAPNGDSYKCFFLAKIALLRGRLLVRALHLDDLMYLQVMFTVSGLLCTAYHGQRTVESWQSTHARRSSSGFLS